MVYDVWYMVYDIKFAAGTRPLGPGAQAVYPISSIFWLIAHISIFYIPIHVFVFVNTHIRIDFNLLIYIH